MIGLLAQLAKAAKLAQTAEAAIGVASNKLGGATPTAPPAKPEGGIPAAYRAVLDGGGLDVRLLLTEGDAAGLCGKPIRRTELVADGGALACDYHCGDPAGTALGVHVSLDEGWEFYDSEIPKMEVIAGLGDAAFRGGRQIYVKYGDIVFWIHTAGEVMVAPAVDAARLVVARLQQDTPPGDP